MKKIRLSRILSILLFGMPLVTWAQFEPNYEYTTEFTWGINKNTNSGLIGGLVLKHGRSRGDNIFETFGLEFQNVKHPKELRYTAQRTGTSFIWAKQNYLFVIRTNYGREIQLSKKAPQQGVQIIAGAAGGPSFGLESPYYLLNASGDYVTYDPNSFVSIFAIDGSGKIFRSIGNATIVPGLNAKTGLTFEFGSFRNNVAGVEIGMAGEIFTRKIIIMPTQENRAFYPSLYFTFFWGTRR